jgi:hypothetical protein
MRYFGIDSQTGNRWYNFDPMMNLACGARGILDSQEDDGKRLFLVGKPLAKYWRWGESMRKTKLFGSLKEVSSSDKHSY